MSQVPRVPANTVERDHSDCASQGYQNGTNPGGDYIAEVQSSDQDQMESIPIVALRLDKNLQHEPRGKAHQFLMPFGGHSHRNSRFHSKIVVTGDWDLILTRDYPSNNARANRICT